MIRRIALVAALTLALGACASDGSGAKEGAEKTASTASKYTAPPAGSKLAKVANGMSDMEVRKIMGDPDNQSNYMTGKAWIPFYFGPAAQSDWIYYGTGRVVFARNRWNGSLKVIRTMYNPNEGK
jgi:hypothetical protein